MFFLLVWETMMKCGNNYKSAPSSGDRQRLGAAIAAYLEYQRLCGSNFPSRATTPVSVRQSVEDLSIAKKWLNLDIYSMQKFLSDVVGPQRIPSHKRYGLEIRLCKVAVGNYCRLLLSPCPDTWSTSRDCCPVGSR